MSGRGGEVPTEAASVLSVTARTSGAGPQAGKVAMESSDRIRLTRAPPVEYNEALGQEVETMDRAVAYLR